MLDEAQRAALYEALAAEAWRRGDLRYKLDDCQLGIYRQIRECRELKFVLNCSRRLGKTFLLCVIAFETAIQKPGCRVRFAAPTGDAIHEIVEPIVIEILKDCPEAMKPHLAWHSGRIEFGNGSVIRLAGCDKADSRERLRGTASDINIVEEGGSIPDLGYVVRDILQPQTISTGGLTLLASTPPKSPAHDFVTIAREAQARGSYAHRTIYDCPRYTPATVEQFKAEAGGEESTTWRREYLAEFVTDADAAVVPEFTDKRAKELVRRQERPAFFDAYVSLDVGWRDGMGAVFGYWDFAAARLVIEREMLLFRANTKTVADAIRGIEADLWPTQKPYLRVSDNDLLVIADLQDLHGLSFVPTAKDDKELQVNELRQWVQAGKLVISPDCPQLIRQLHTTIWNRARTSYERGPDGHGDLLDALVYLIRNVIRSRNPVPPGHGLDARHMHINTQPNAGAAAALRAALGVRRR